MTHQNQYLAEVFKEPPLTAFKRQTNIRDLLIKSKLPDSLKKNEPRNIKGMTKCGQTCAACPYIKVGKQIKLKDNKQWTINKKVNFKSYNIIYLIECHKDNCIQRYIGEAGRIL